MYGNLFYLNVSQKNDNFKVLLHNASVTFACTCTHISIMYFIRKKVKLHNNNHILW